ncbi:MAG: alpha/beta fold hydrolase [Thermoplasmataceae archaeon]
MDSEKDSLDYSFINSGGNTIRFSKKGNGKTNMILIHGLGAFAEVWDPLIECFDKNKYTIYTLDLPGHGKSRYKEEEMKDFYYENSPFIKALDLLIESEKISKPILVGNSMGGGVALIYSIFRKDKISGCALIDPFGAGNKIGIMYRMMSLRPINWYFRRQKPNWETVTAGWGQSFNAIKPPEWLIQKSLEYYGDNENWLWYFRLVRYAVNIFGLKRKNLDLIRSKFSKSMLPKIIIWGGKDQVLNIEEGKKYFNSVNGSYFVTINDAGHVPMIEFPKEVGIKITEFAESINS